MRSIPEHWPKHYNANTEACDLIDGPCACGSWHCETTPWVAEMIERFGWIGTMSERAERHLTHMKAETIIDMDRKYRAGNLEHGDDLLDMDALRLVDEAISEAMDQVVYLRTLKSRLMKGNKK